MEEKLVSVIIPTHKGAKTIARALESALNQSYQNTEIIIVDDNGEGVQEQKQTEKAIEKYMTGGKVKYIKHKENRRGAAARNTGIKASSGEYLAFLDDDDVWFTSKLQRQVEIFESLPPEYGMIYCGGYNVDNDGYGGKTLSTFPKGNILYDFMLGKVNFNSSTLMIRRDVLQTVVGFNENYRRLQDWEFCTRILYKYKGYGMKEYLVVKYRAERNLTSNPEQLRDIYQYHMREIKEILDSLGKARRKKVTARFQRRIALEYFRYHDYRTGFQYLRKDQNIVTGIFLLSKYVLSHGIYRLVNQRRKIVPA